MASYNLPNVDGMSSLEQIKNAVGIMTKELGWLLSNLDTKNMNEIDGDILVTGTVTAGKINVNELSAISANLGHITAGLIEAVQIFGSYIATRQDDYPRCEMSATGNVFGAFNDANNHIDIEPNYAGSPAISFTVAGIPRGRIHNLLGYPIFESNSSMGLESSGNIFVNTNQMIFANWDKLFASNPGRTLGDELREIFDRIEALEGG
ncbi:hypothetical protein GCM10008014_08230 [Paenibacillus silvae]|uniref:Tail fiber protein n=1 Tax=Paenibacillus silvae TaxID=1325358 RepID=A0ABQ1Z3K5_9BACL|nr:hypothetical protein [Paenibacillus silvae]GGH45905.1 hypothetical protein GCM10008014_08230 [Paenibacillus silvae]